MPASDFIAVGVVGLVWLFAALVPGRIRRALRDGLRCMGRYPDLWRIPAVLGVAYAMFNLLGILLLMHRTGGNIDSLARDLRWPETWPSPTAALADSALLAAEFLAGVFNVFGPTFPASALFALLILANWGGYLAEFASAVCKRFRRIGPLLVFLSIVCFISAVLKPIFFVGLPEIIAWWPDIDWVRIGSAVDVTSFAFEFLLGACFQVYLMLMASAWARGVRFRRERLMHFAIRRLGFVMKWSLTLLGAILIFVQIPLLAAFAFGGDESIASFVVNRVGRPVIAALMISLCAVQAKLVFHNESLRRALRDGLQFARQNLAMLALLLIAQFIPFLLLAATGEFIYSAFAIESLPAYVWIVFQPVALAFLSGWFVAAWVQFFRRAEGHRGDVLF